MRGQARRLPAKPSEVWMDFEAFLLAPSNYSDKSKNARREGQQWIHTTVLACLEEAECQPVNFLPYATNFCTIILIILFEL